MSQDVQIRKAYSQAVRDYKPWHNHGTWNSSGNDAFWQLIDGGMRHGFFDAEQAGRLFDESQSTIQAWAAKAEVPPRKTRIKVWKTIKKLTT